MVETSRLPRGAVAGAVTAVGAAAMHAGPLLTSVPPLRPLWPGLAGLGRPGHIALTFDDGPDETSTPLFLDVLAAHGVQATFFLLGEMVTRFPDLPRRMVDEGHELAVHSWDHRTARRWDRAVARLGLHLGTRGVAVGLRRASRASAAPHPRRHPRHNRNSIV